MWHGNATVLFCDDVRQELSGKLTIVGLYQGYLGLRTSQFQLPRFYALALVELPPAYGGQSMRVQLKDRDSVLFKADVNLPNRPEPLSAEGSDAEILRLSMPIEVTPLVVHADMRLRLSLDVGDWNYESQELPVVLNPPGSAQVRT